MFFRSPKRKKQNNQGQENFTTGLYNSLELNIENIKKILDQPDDLVTRKFAIGENGHTCAIVYIDGLTDTKVINDEIMKNLQIELEEVDKSSVQSDAALLDKLSRQFISISNVKKVKTLDDLSLAILSGDTALFVDGIDQLLLIDTKNWKSRNIEEPVSEGTIRGPRDGFTENIRTNTMLLRRRIRDANLRFKSYQIGRRSRKSLIVSYIDGVVHPNLLKEVNRRLETIDVDDAPESGYIEQWIEDNFLSPFPQMQNTERPDKVAAALTEGKIAIILDGTPFVLIAPATFGSMMHSPEDYYERWMIGSLLRVLRYFAAFLAVFLPALYIALVSYHPGLIPSKLAFSIAATREGLPFPAVIEALLMEITMELLREAGIRLPKPIGQTIGIVGGLVIGEAAVSAGIVSPVMVIIVAVTAIASFSLPSYSFAISIRMLRFGFMIAAAFFGLYGIILAYIMVNIHIVNLKSFGIPYSTPFAPAFKGDWKDLVLRVPITMMNRRPKFLQTEDEKRIDKEDKS
ncbi:spore germination protein [Halobacillus shinanisalinarum]|uniref:Spore germination protein n=1 Tax=Halobacillus shinanisalinarum TaxID=2932258 RepID=A0ABY4GXY4_9BACI|nr:spore germination protein [Halobacillus shinanisalinarum]UOQ92919.1 spore germination protein [Halobacillus shinanisalinarum]